MKLPPFLAALLLAMVVHTAAFGGLLVVAFWPTYTPPFLIEAYGDSDREGFPIATIATTPGAHREADDQTPGGDDAPEAMLHEPKLGIAPAALPTLVAEPRAAPAETETPVIGSEVSPVPANKPEQAAGLPGGAGGARMPKGTPSAGGTVGSRKGVREAGVSRPPYPHEAREAGIEGTVVIWLHISAEGEVLEAKVHKSSGSKILDNSTLRWIKSQKFLPARQDNKPVEAQVTKAFEFSLY